MLSDMEQLLLHISGNDGIVSKVGQAISSNGRGDLTSYDSRNAENLNLLSRVFFKAEIDSPVYTSLVQSGNNFVLSYMGSPPRYALCDDKIKELHYIISRFTGDDGSKIQLFQKMYECRNDILQQKLMDRLKCENQKKRKGEDNNFDFFNKAKNYYKPDDSFKEILNHELFRQFVLENFDSILPMQNFLEAVELVVNNNDNVRFDYMNTKDIMEKYRGVHVEVKGIDHLKTINPEAKEFYVGLANKNNSVPGCCAGCTSELNAVSNVINDYSFLRTGDFYQNFPPANYQPSPLVTTNPDVFQKFIDLINELLISVIRNSSNESLLDHSFFRHCSNVDSIGNEEKCGDDSSSMIDDNYVVNISGDGGTA